MRAWPGLAVEAVTPVVSQAVVSSSGLGYLLS